MNGIPDFNANGYSDTWKYCGKQDDHKFCDAEQWAEDAPKGYKREPSTSNPGHPWTGGRWTKIIIKGMK